MKQIRRAPPPSRAFTDLKGSTAADLTAAQYDQIIADAYLEESNRQDLLDLALVAGPKQSAGGPRAGTSQVVQAGKTDTGAFAFFQAAQGEVWILEEMTLEAATSGSYTLSLSLEVEGASMTIIPTGSKTDSFLLFSQAYGWPTTNFYLDENVKIGIELGGSFSSISINALMTRFR